MNAVTARRAWYAEMADLLGPNPAHMRRWPESDVVRVMTHEEAARLAAHFGRLALGHTDVWPATDDHDEGRR